MKTILKLSQCILVTLLFSASCSKEPHSNSAVNLQNSEKRNGIASTSAVSSVVSYSKDNTTTVTSINNYPGYQKVVLYSIGPLTVAAADIVSAHLQQELTYPGSSQPVNPMAACDIVVGTNSSVVDQTSPGFVGWISRPSGGNMSKLDEISVEVLTRTGSYKFASAASGIYINAAFYGASPMTVPNFTVPAGPYGELIAVVERGVTRYETTAYNLPMSGSDYICPPDAPTQHVQYSLLANIPAGTMVEARYQVQATATVSGATNHQKFGRSAIVGTSATDVSGTTLVRQIQAGITPGEHHWTASHAGGAYYPTAVTGAYFNTPVYSSGGTGNPLVIDGPGPNLYGHFVVEMRPYVGFYQDLTKNFTTINATPTVLYSVGPITLDANQVAEIRYMVGLDPTAQSTVDSKIIRATSATATTGIVVQPPLARVIGPNYVYSNLIHSTAEKNGSTQATGQYYNVVVWKISGANVNAHEWGELEVVKR